jgi:hypothetical protein
LACSLVLFVDPHVPHFHQKYHQGKKYNVIILSL